MPGPKHGANSGKRVAGPRGVLVAYDMEGKPILKARTPNKKQAAKLERRKAAFSAGQQGQGLLCHMPGSQNRKK